MPARSRRPLQRRLWNWITFTRLRMTLTTVTTVAVLLMVSVGAAAWDKRTDECGPDVFREGATSECIGVTDGSFVFAPDLTAVEKAIQAENQSLGSAYATIALLLPMTDPDPVMQTEILHEVQGAHAAQYLANHQDNDTKPKIKLVLSNPGLDSARWSDAVSRLKSMTGAPDNLRAVVGISVSTDTTRAEVTTLTKDDGIPVVGGAISADDISNTAKDPKLFPGLARVSATNQEVASALANVSGVNPKQTVLVEDTRTGDDYISSLASAFASEAKYPVEPYEFQSPSNVSQVGYTGNTFQNTVVPHICADKGARWIYFAGRQVQLREFINALGSGCPDGHFTLLTGSAASHLIGDPNLHPAVLGHGINLEYAAIASSGAWTGQRLPATGGSRSDYAEFLHALDKAGPIDLADGQAIINYDAAWTAISGIRLAANNGQMLSTSEVGGIWSQLNAGNEVGGASGWICLDNLGNPYDKAIPIVSYAEDGKPSFDQFAWPAGSPPDAQCEVRKVS